MARASATAPLKRRPSGARLKGPSWASGQRVPHREETARVSGGRYSWTIGARFWGGSQSVCPL